MSAFVEKSEFRALVVDDDPIARRTVSWALRQEGFVCDVAADGEQASALLDDTVYDLLVTDLQMPNKHGHSLATEVLAGPACPKIMVHTSVDDPRLTKDLMLRGVDDIVYKPANYASFAAKAMGLVERARTLADRQESVEAKTEESEIDEKESQEEAAAAHNAPVGLEELKATLADVAAVLPVSRTALDVAEMVRADSFDAEHVAAAVQRDSKIAAKVLQLANNPFYNPSGQHIADIKQAVVRIGQKRVGEFALAMSAFSSVTPDTQAWIDMDAVWQRSVAAGIAMELLIAQGKHAHMSEGLLFSALMHYTGRAVLCTHYPDRYAGMIKSCAENESTLLQHENQLFPQNHAEVMCNLLADWSLPSEVYQPLRHTLDDYPALSTLPEPMRTKAELVKLAILLGQIAVGSWEPWDLIELPPRKVLVRLRIQHVDSIIEKIEAQLPGVTNFSTDHQQHAFAAVPQKSAPQEVTYCNLSNEPFDFVAKIVPSMGIRLKTDGIRSNQPARSALVNRIGTEPEHSISRLLTKYQHVVFVRDMHSIRYVRSRGTNIGLPCSYAALRSACWQAVSNPR